jgi:16S rRNA (cytosine967-C5)-methyltransferase
MEDRLLNLAAAIIGKADKEHPADIVLREQLRASGKMPRAEAGEISRTVFAYYRWLGWLDRRRPVTAQLKRALDLDNGYAERPESFSDEKVLVRCVPSWTPKEVRVSAPWVRSLQTWPRLWLRAKPGTAGTLAGKLRQAKTCGLPDAVLFLGEEDLFRTPQFHAGEFEIQDLASQAVGRWCDPQPGETWWDACAGEGGKTLHLSALMRNKGLIWASDRADWRLKRLKLRAGRAGCFNYRVVAWEGGGKPPTKTRFDGVLVDAPCSGTGTWQRNPHARWTTSLEDVRELAEIQKRLLLNVAGSVKPGGKLIYAVCTLTRTETEGVANAVDAELPGFEPLPLPDLFKTTNTPAPRQWLWPQDTGGNGMFVAAWRKLPEPDPKPKPGNPAASESSASGGPAPLPPPDPGPARIQG